MVVLPFNRRAPVIRHPFDGPYLDRLRAGDVDTERHFCSYFSEWIRIKVRARGMAALFDDIRQETFFRVLNTLRSPDGLRDPGALGAFVSSVCSHVILETGRARTRDGIMPPDEPEAVADHDAPSAETQLLAEERKLAVRTVIDDLAPRDRELLAALFLEEEDRNRVCEQMGVTRDYLRVLVHRAKHEFKTRYLAAIERPASGAVAGSTRARKR